MRATEGPISVSTLDVCVCLNDKESADYDIKETKFSLTGLLSLVSSSANRDEQAFTPANKRNGFFRRLIPRPCRHVNIDP
jgi:hypothetical protein